MTNAKQPDEQQYTDPKTGKPIVYADNVPEILRGDLTLSHDSIRIGRRLAGLSHFARAAEGKDAWNLWVVWAEIEKNRWLEAQDHSDHIFVRIKYMADRGGKKAPIEFGKQLKAIHADVSDFAGFVFPSLVSFQNIHFAQRADFSGAFFSGIAVFNSALFKRGASFLDSIFWGDAQFRNAIFSDEAQFQEVRFFEGSNFKGARFEKDVSFEKAILNRGLFENAQMKGHSTFLRAEFFQGASFYRAKFLKQSLFGGVKFSSDVTFQDTSFFDIAGFDYLNALCKVDFSEAVFQSKVIMSHSSFSDTLTLENATFEGLLEFQECTVSEQVKAKGCKFHGDCDFTKTHFDEGIVLDSAVFLSNCTFNEAVFGAEMRCVKADFGGTVNANNCTYFGYGNWAGATFSRSLNLRKSRFLKRTNFVNCKFEGHVDIDHGTFGTLPQNHESRSVPNFIGARFSIPPNLSFTTIPAPSLPKYLRWYERLVTSDGLTKRPMRILDRRAAAKYRRLQELASLGHNQIAEKRFFREELMARRGHEAKTWREITMINLFELFSMCGLSFWRPIWWWLALFAAFFAIYGWLAGLFDAGWSVEDSFHLINYTFSNATPVLGVIKASDSAAVQALFTGGQPPWVTLLAGVHNLVSTIFLFFALLAVRNYFKLG